MLGNCPDDSSGPGDLGALWRVPGRGFNVAPAADSATVYFGGLAHDVIAVDKTSGRVRWRANTGVTSLYTEGSNVVLAVNVVAIGDVDVHAFDRATGERRWTFQTEDLDVMGHGLLAVAGDVIFASSFKNRVYAIDAHTGAQRWMTQLPGESAGAAFDPTVHDSTLFVGIKRIGIPTTGGLAALDTGTGAIRWVREFAPSYPGALYGCLGGAVFHGEHVIVGAEDGRIYAFDRRTGDTAWIAPRVHTLPPASGGTYGDTRPLLVAGDMVIAGSTQGTLVGLDAATGAERWRGPQDLFYIGVNYASDGDTVFVTADGVEGIDPKTGSVVWRRGAGALTETVFISPALPEPGRLFVSGGRGFYALRR
jgi:outer membrane protein assembly factor BamB